MWWEIVKHNKKTKNVERQNRVYRDESKSSTEMLDNSDDLDDVDIVSPTEYINVVC